MKFYQPEVYFTRRIEDKNEEFVEVVTFILPKGATFPVTVAGVNCKALIDKGTTRSCISETFYNQLVLPWSLKAFCLSNFCLW